MSDLSEKDRQTVLDEAMLAPDTAEIAPGVIVHRFSLALLRRLSRLGNPIADISSTAAGTAANLSDFCEAAFIASATGEDYGKYLTAGVTGREKILDDFCAKLTSASLNKFAEFIRSDAVAVRAAQSAAAPQQNSSMSKNARGPRRAHR